MFRCSQPDALTAIATDPEGMYAAGGTAAGHVLLWKVRRDLRASLLVEPTAIDRSNLADS